MKKSTWLQAYETEVREKRNQSNQKKKVIFILLPVMMILMFVGIISSSDLSNPEVRSSMMVMGGVFAFTLLFVIFIVSISKKKDVTKYTSQNLSKLLTSDEEVDKFDQQMNTAPINEVAIASETTIFITEDYLGKKWMASGDLRYDFIRLSDIASFNYTKTGSNTGNPLNAAFFFDIRNAKQSIILNGSADSGKQLEAFIALLQDVKPEIKIN